VRIIFEIKIDNAGMSNTKKVIIPFT